MNRETVEPFWNRDTLEECVRGSRDAHPQQFAHQLRDYLGGGQVYLRASGREALSEFIAQAVRPGSTILMCSFNCWVVADAASRAGHPIETFDLASPRGGFDWRKVGHLLDRRHGALIVPHFFGAPSDFREVVDAAKATDTLIIEDCAHALGAKIAHQTVGTMGDAAIFSFNYDKPISLAGGGALLVNNPSLAERFNTPHVAPSSEMEHRQLCRYLDVVAQLRSWIRHSDGWWKQLQRGMRLARWLPKTIPTQTKGIGPLRAALGCWQLQRYPNIARKRNENTDYLRHGIEHLLWKSDADTTPAWLRQKVVLPSGGLGHIERRLRSQGLRVGRLNWHQTLENRLGGTPPAHAAYAAANGLDVPIHQNMTKSDLDVIRTTVMNSANVARAA